MIFIPGDTHGDVRRLSTESFFEQKEMTKEDYLIILGDFGLEIMEKVPTRFHCDCSKKRVEKAIVSLGENDLKELIADNEPIEVSCHFCNTNYVFTPEEMQEILVRSGRA